MLEAAVRAPDHGQLAPWRFFVLEPAQRDRFAEVVAAARLQRDPHAPPEALEAERNKIKRIPMIIVVACVIAPGSEKIPPIERVLAVGAAVQNLLLAAHALGYGAVWKTGAAAYDAAVKGALGLTPADHLIAIVHVGTALASAPVRQPQLDGVVLNFS